jgi:hypothetical protein
MKSPYLWLSALFGGLIWFSPWFGVPVCAFGLLAAWEMWVAWFDRYQKKVKITIETETVNRISELERKLAALSVRSTVQSQGFR